MAVMVLSLKVLHIVIAAAWFGHKLLIPADLRSSLRRRTLHTDSSLGLIGQNDSAN